MYFYEILLNQKIPSQVLTYKSDLILEQGRLVKVPIRNKFCYGVVLNQLENINFEIEKTKSVDEILPYIFSANQLKLIKITAQNTFNSVNTVFDAFFQPFKLLTKKDWLLLKEKFENENPDTATLNSFLDLESKSEEIQNNDKEPEIKLNQTINAKPEFYIENDILVRIIYIIRSQINRINDKALSNQQILVLFPEKKLLDKVLSQLKQNSEFNKIINGTDKILDQARNDNCKVEILNFSGDVSAKSKIFVKELLLSKSNQIIFGTRSSLFLPFNNLNQIIVVDEANSFYIQEQNNLYYDARDLAFLISLTFNAKLSFVSTLPSSRLHSFYSKKLLDTNIITNTNNIKKPLKIQISQRNIKSDTFGLFSDLVEHAITEKDTNIGYYESLEE